MPHIVISGSGIAGLTAARRLATRHEVTLVTKRRLGESTTALAQGGTAGVIGSASAAAGVVGTDADSVGAHVADTLAAGAGVCDEDAVRVLCEEGPDRILDLAAGGVEFDRDASGAWARGMEGAHSSARSFHSGGDAIGKAIIDALSQALLAEVAAGRVDLHEETMLVDVLTGSGPTATGDGLAAAIRAGAEVRDLEFFQFHPTALAGAGFLVSEAVRGAGALLLDAADHRFMPEVDPRAELAPRDVVALTIHRRMAAQGGGSCLLDATAVPELAERFPSITRGLAEHGLDPAVDLIPITPAAHYFMGGIATDLDGRTSFARAFTLADANVEVELSAGDGDLFADGDRLAVVSGPARAVLRAERIALNFCQRKSGIATQTRAFVAAAREAGPDPRVRIVDNRKTTPALRAFEKHAVVCGGGSNHRFGLSDAVMVKDNHLAVLTGQGHDIAAAIRAARQRLPHTTTIEVEVDRLDQIAAVLEGGADIIMLDNFSLTDLRAGVELIAGQVIVEASGNVALDTVAQIAATGVDVISSGALTHSVRAIDLGLDLDLQA